jgi:hypothetical protein
MEEGRESETARLLGDWERYTVRARESRGVTRMKKRQAAKLCRLSRKEKEGWLFDVLKNTNSQHGNYSSFVCLNYL